MSELVEIELHLSPAQINKARNGHPIQIKSSDLHKTTHKIKVHPHHAKKIHSAKRRQKGVRLHLTEDEMRATGFFDKLRDAAKFVKNRIIDTDTYQKFAKPFVRQLVDTGVNAIPVGGPVKDLIKKGVDAVGQKTNAYGLKSAREKTVQKFVAESMAMPTPGNGAFTSYPQPATGDGMNSAQIHHHYYYPMDHGHLQGKGRRGRIGPSGSFKLA